LVVKVTEAIAGFIIRNSLCFIIAAIVITGAAVPGLTLLRTETGFEALISTDSKIYRDNVRFEAAFGAEPVTVLLSGEISEVLAEDNLAVIAEFEDYILGDERFRNIVSPVSLLEIDTGQSYTQNPRAIKEAVFDGEGNLNPVLHQLAPDKENVLLLVTPAGNMSKDESLELVKHIEDFFAGSPVESAGVTVISDAGLIDAISIAMGRNIAILLGLSVAVMLVILSVSFRVHWRLLSLLMVGISAFWTFGLMGYLSVPLSMATMAVLPILIGLGIDFSIQFHNRYQEEITRCGSVGGAIVVSISRMFPVIGVALLATIAGFITLYISEVPMIQDFGLMLAVGVILSYIVGLFLLHSIVYLADKRTRVEKLKVKSREASGRIEWFLAKMGKLAIRHTAWILIFALAPAVLGGIFDSRLPVNTDYEELMPQDETALVELRNLRHITGSGGEIRFLIGAEKITSPEVLNWVHNFGEQAMLDHPEIISASSPATVIAQAAGGIIPPVEQIDNILQATPEMLRSRVISDDLTMAVLTLNIQYIDLEDTYDLINSLQQSASPPEGIEMSPVGTTALGASTIDAVIGSRMLMNGLCLGAVFLIILLSCRHPSRAVFTIIPVGAVIAWTSLVMFILGVPLNPLTAVLGVIIIGIGTEFMVLINGRYDEEKRHGYEPGDAMVTAITKTGRAVMTTALTTLGGFGVLLASNFVMIRDFGIATVVGVVLCLVITLTVMPGLVVWYDRLRYKNQR